MKKVKSLLSFARNMSAVKKGAAVFTTAAIALTSVTCAAQFADDAIVSGFEADSVQEILRLSESYLSPSAENQVSDLGVALTDPANRESETTQRIKELSTGSVSEKTTAQEEKTTEKEKITAAPATKTASVATASTTQAVTAADKTASAEGGYTFAQLGLKQMSDIPVPDDILFDANGVPLNYKSKLSGKSTTYTMGTTTATGTRVHPGVIAVNPKIIPYGTKMYIVASDGSGYVYGYSSAEDTGGFIYWDNGPLVDMYVNCYADACYWGNKPVTIYIF